MRMPLQLPISACLRICLIAHSIAMAQPHKTKWHLYPRKKTGQLSSKPTCLIFSQIFHSCPRRNCGKLTEITKTRKKLPLMNQGIVMVYCKWFMLLDPVARNLLDRKILLVSSPSTILTQLWPRSKISWILRACRISRSSFLLRFMHYALHQVCCYGLSIFSFKGHDNFWSLLLTHGIESSVWHLCCLMIRQCVELGFHRQPRTDEKSTHLDEFKKRLFWSIYQLERRTALVLGRPFSIDDDEIDISWPQYVEDDNGEDSPEPSQNGHDHRISNYDSTPEQPRTKAQSDISFHSLCIMIDQLNTKSRLTLCRLAKASPGEKVQRKIAKRFRKLEDWKSSIFGSTTECDCAIESAKLTFPTPRTPIQTPISRPPLAERQRLALLLNYHRARRLLLQTILTDVRLPNQPFPYSSFAKSSGEVCQLNRRLHRLKPVTFTLLDLHSVFVAGFSMVYCAWSDPQLYDAEMATDFGACSTVLYLIAEQWGAGAKKYRDAFELVAEKTAEHVLSTKSSRGSGQQQHPQNFSVGQLQAHLGGVTSTGENVFGNGMHNQGDPYDAHRSAAGEEVGNENFDLWQMISQSWPAHQYTLDYDAVEFTGMENLLVEEGLGWLNGGTSL
jgi:hypothetical protein